MKGRKALIIFRYPIAEILEGAESFLTDDLIIHCVGLSMQLSLGLRLHLRNVGDL